MLLCVLITIVSKGGHQILSRSLPNVFDTEFINKQVHLIELILCMEEFLKHGQLRKGDLKDLPKLIVHFINCITSTCKREGMGNRLIKNHLYFHLHDYMTQWGQPKGWDSAFSESHHKGSIKAPSKATQQNQHTLIEQTANRKTEYKNITIAKLHYQTIEQSVPQTNPKKITGGSHFEIFPDPVTKLPTMKWKSSTNKNKPFFTNDVLKFCCDKILPLQYDKRFVRGFTEHNRADDATGTNYLFRCHPSYRINTGQTIKLLSPQNEVQTKTQDRKTTSSPQISYLCQLSQSQARAEHKPARVHHITDSIQQMIPKALKIILQKQRQLSRKDNLLSSLY